MPSELLTASEVAQRLGISVATVQRWQTAGYLLPVKVGKGYVRYRSEDIDQLVAKGTA